MKDSGVYLILNLCNNNFYIGSSNNFIKRKRAHFYKLKNNKHDNIHLQRAFNLYGKENFEFIIVELLIKEDLKAFEQLFLDEWFGKLECYNLYQTAEGPLNYKHTQKFKDNCAKRMIGNDYAKGNKFSLKFINPEANVGENNPRANLTTLQVRGIKYLLKLCYKQSLIRKAYNVTRSIVNHIAREITYKDVKI